MRREKRFNKILTIILCLIFLLPGSQIILAKEFTFKLSGYENQGSDKPVGLDWQQNSVVSAPGQSKEHTIKSRIVDSTPSDDMDIIPKVGSKKTTVRVTDFKYYGKRHSNSGINQLIAGRLISAIETDKNLEIIESETVDKKVKDLESTIPGNEYPSNSIELLKQSGAGILISGFVIKYQDTVEIDARITDVETSSIITVERVKGPAGTSKDKLIDEIIKKILNNFPLKKYIVDRQGGEVIIDLGSSDGLKSKMYYMVFEKYEIINDSAALRTPDINQKMIGIIRVEKVRTKTATAIIMFETYPGAVTNGQTVVSTENVRIIA